MTEHKFTDEEIIRALECCANADCLNCPRWSEEWVSGMCADFLPLVLNLINRQRAEIKRFADIGKMYSEIKAEAVKEFAEALKKYYRHIDKTAGALIEYTIDAKVKEFLEGDKGGAADSQDND